MPYVDLSECLRVFPDRFKTESKSKLVDNQNETVVDNPVAESFQELLDQKRTLETDMQSMRERLQIAETRREQAESREQWLRDHVDKLADQNQKLLSAPSHQKKGWIARIFGGR
jgi:DNA gyrase/topoisomerase IV subunit B